jgi:hypothetical protein
MSTVNLTLGGKKQIATVTVTDTNGVVIPASQLTFTQVQDTPNIVAESATTFGTGQFAALAVGSTNVTWSAALTPANGGGSPVAAAPDTLTVARAPIATVTVAYTESPS